MVCSPPCILLMIRPIFPVAELNDPNDPRPQKHKLLNILCLPLLVQRKTLLLFSSSFSFSWWRLGQQRAGVVQKALCGFVLGWAGLESEDGGEPRGERVGAGGVRTATAGRLAVGRGARLEAGLHRASRVRRRGVFLRCPAHQPTKTKTSKTWPCRQSGGVHRRRRWALSRSWICH